MNTSITRLSGLLFSVSSLAFFFLLTVYQYYFGALAETWTEQLALFTKDWNIIGFIWGAELVAVVLIAWSSLNLAKRNRFWNLVAIGHLLLLVKYVVLLGGYPIVESQEMYLLINRLAILVFAVANVLWIIGMVGLYAFEEGWVRYVGTGIAVIAGGLFLLIFSGGITMESVVMVLPLALTVYALNVIYGIRVFVNQQYTRRR